MALTQDAQDQIIAASVEDAVRCRLGKVGHHSLKAINCQFRNGTLFLRGEVATYYLKQMAQESIRTLNGIGRIVNDIEVVY